jgi:hypothetical protein
MAIEEQLDMYPFRTDIYAELVKAAILGKTINYLDLPGEGGSPFNVGRYLERIGRAESEQGRPPLTAVVVQKNSGKPGKGFASLMDDLGLRLPGETNDAMWRRAIHEVYEYWHRDLAR